MPISPSAASFGISSLGKCCASSHSRDVRPDLGLGELADGAAQQLLLVGQPEVHDCSDYHPHGPTINPGRTPGRVTGTGVARRGSDDRIPSGLALALYRASCRVSCSSATRGAGVGRGRHHRRSSARTRRRRTGGRSGVAVGSGLLIVGFEFEYAHTERGSGRRLRRRSRPAWATCCCRRRSRSSASSRISRPAAPVYRETLGDAQETRFGIERRRRGEVSLVGPLRLRVDYRVFKLGSDALTRRAPRLRGTEPEVLTAGRTAGKWQAEPGLVLTCRSASDRSGYLPRSARVRVDDVRPLRIGLGVLLVESPALRLRKRLRRGCSTPCSRRP